MMQNNHFATNFLGVQGVVYPSQGSVSVMVRAHTEMIFYDPPQPIRSLLCRTKSHFSVAETDTFLWTQLYVIGFKYILSGYNKVPFTGMWPLYQGIHVI